MDVGTSFLFLFKIGGKRVDELLEVEGRWALPTDIGTTLEKLHIYCQPLGALLTRFLKNLT